MQITQKTGKSICQTLNMNYDGKTPFNPTDNIMIGTYYFSALLKARNGNLEEALAAYNGGTKASQQYKDYKKGMITQNSEMYLHAETKKYVISVKSKIKFIRKNFP